MTAPTALLLLLPLLLLHLLLARALSQTFEQPDVDALTNATTLASTSRPLALALAPHGALLAPLLEHIDFISTAVVASARAARNRSSEPITTTCNYGAEDRWKPNARGYFAQRSWGAVDVACVTDVYGAGPADGVAIVDSPRPGATSRDVFDAVLAHSRGVDAVAREAAANAGFDWPAATRGNEFQYSVRTQNCVHDYAGFVRRGPHWFVSERITNAEKDLNLGETMRHYLLEYVRLENGRVMNAEVEALESKTDEATAESDVPSFARGTTVLTKSNGAVTGNEYGFIFAPDNLAVRDALRAGEHNTQQASDATTPSNIAILALPLAMNVVPVALIADVNTAGMLVYTLLTDILTTIPLLIKGVEVLAIGVDTNVVVVTRVTGANVEGDANKAGEVWVAECRANGDLTATGVALIVVAVGFMVGGVLAEIIAQKWVKRRGSVDGGKTSAGLVVAGVVGRGKNLSDATKNA